MISCDPCFNLSKFQASKEVEKTQIAYFYSIESPVKLSASKFFLNYRKDNRNDIDTSRQLSSVDSEGLQFPEKSKSWRFWKNSKLQNCEGKFFRIFRCLRDFRRIPQNCSEKDKIRVVRVFQIINLVSKQKTLPKIRKLSVFLFFCCLWKHKLHNCSIFVQRCTWVKSVLYSKNSKYHSLNRKKTSQFNKSCYS